jgi:hypothetical protein
MPQPLTIALTAFATLVVTVLGGLFLDFIRNARPTISCGVKDAVPIDLDGRKSIGAYVVSLENTSSPIVKEFTCHIKAPAAKLRNGGVGAPQGLEISVQETEAALSVSVPYLKRGEKLEITVIAEGLYVPPTPVVAIRSPFEVKVVRRSSESAPSYQTRFVLAGLVAALAGFLVPLVLERPMNFSSQKDVLTFAASVSGLPRLAEEYALASADIRYYNQGDMASALASSTSDRAEIEKYRRLLAVTLEMAAAGMESTSRANLSYSMGKIDLLLGNKERAVRDFREAVNRDKSLTTEKSQRDDLVRQFLISNALN